MTITTLFLPKYNQTVFVLKHTFIYLFFASFTILLVRYFYSKLLQMYHNVLTDNKLILFRVFTFIMIGLFLFIGRNIQLNYIALYESPPVVHCYYYDEYGNYIHGSKMTYVCPTLEVIEQEDNFLKVRATYEYPGNDTSHLKRDNDGPYYRGVDGYAVVDIEVAYGEDNYITTYKSQTSWNYELLEFRDIDSTDEGVLSTYYRSLQLVIETDYGEDAITQSKTTHMFEDSDVDYTDIKDVNHYDFSSDDPLSVQSLELVVTSKANNKIDFEVYQYNLDNPLRFLGYIENNNDQTKVFFEYNPEYVNVEPKEISNTYTITDDTVTRSKLSGIHNTIYTYHKFSNINGYIETNDVYYQSNEFQHEHVSEIFSTNDSFIIEGDMQTYKVFNTEYGFVIEKYQGDNHKEEIPNSHEYELIAFFTGIDHLVFDYGNPIRLVYDNQPVSIVNPMIRYLYRK